MLLHAEVRSWRQESSWFLSAYILRQSLKVNPECTDLFSPASEFALEIPCPCLPRAGISGKLSHLPRIFVDPKG